jgi:S-DNA-T family DNA segregation ATPase FtsK/SpoIIIE
MRRPRGEVVMTSAGDLVVMRPKRFELPWWAVVPGLIARLIWRLMWWCLRHPSTTTLTVIAVWLYAKFGWAESSCRSS